jgi:hypothetical protein
MQIGSSFLTIDRHEGLQWLERAVAVKGADLFEADSRPTPMCAL